MVDNKLTGYTTNTKLGDEVMESQNREPVKDDTDSVDANVSNDRRAALAKLAYGSPAIAALFFSKSAAAQASPPPFTPPPPP